MKFEGKRIIGVTGGIGVGKTMVLEIFKTEFDAEIIEADKIAHKIMESGTEGYKKVVEAFGTDILDEMSEDTSKPIDRKKLGDKVFASEKELEKLNGLTHPLVHKEIQRLIECSSKSLIVIEAAILTETSLKELCDAIWYIYAREDVRLERLEKNRGISRERAMAIIKNQPDEDSYRRACQVVIDNSGDRHNTLMQIINNNNFS